MISWRRKHELALLRQAPDPQPLNSYVSGSTKMNSRARDLVEDGSRDSLLRPNFSFSSSEVEKLEGVFDGVSRLANSADSFITTTSFALSGLGVPEEKEKQLQNFLLAVGNGIYTLSSKLRLLEPTSSSVGESMLSPSSNT